MMYEIRQGQPGKADFSFYGGVRDFVRYQGPEAVVHGPAETGKTLGALWKLHICASKYPKASIVIIRKTLQSTYSTVLQTFTNKVLGPDKEEWPCVAYGGSKPEWFDYRNGSRIWLAGLDKAGKVLSAEHDLIYVNQAEELTVGDWETLTTRTTGRAGNMPYSQTIGDANPAYPQHWMYHRDSLKLFYSRHAENPALYDQQTGQITAQGERTMATLENLTGVRRERLLLGRPALAEGAIYTEYIESQHRIYREHAPAFRRYIASQDWGYRNPGVLGVWGLTGNDDMYLTAQYYSSMKLIDWWIERALEVHREFGLEAIICDPSEPEYIERFRRAGLPAIPADNAVRPGIDACKRYLADNRIFFIRDNLRHEDIALVEGKQPLCMEDEFPSYVWADKATKEEPVKVNDHGMDMMRYAVMYVEAPRIIMPQEGIYVYEDRVEISPF